MALTPRPHGITQTEAPISQIDLEAHSQSIWGLVVTAPAAVTADNLSIGEPILVTDVEAMVALAGTDGTAPVALKAIADCGRSIGVLSVVAPDTDADTLGGLEVLRAAEQVLGVKPRIIAAPGLDTLAVTSALALTARELNAFAYAAAIGETPVEIKAYRDTHTAREVMLVSDDFLAPNPPTAAVGLSYATARAVGLRAMIDREVGYHKSISNVPVPGVVGLTRPRSWDLHSANTDMGLINGADVTGLIRQNGFRFWGNRTCSTDPRFVFEVAVRTNQFLRDLIGQQLLPYIDQPLRTSLALDIIESINAAGRREVRAGRLIGFGAFLSSSNTEERLGQGKLNIGYRFTPCAPLEELGITSEITDDYYADLAALAQAA